MKTDTKQSALIGLTILIVVFLLTGYSGKSNAEIVASPEPTAVSSEQVLDQETEASTDSVVPDETISPQNAATTAESDVQTETTGTPAPAEDVEPPMGMFDPWFEAYTGISYSSGTDNQWAYGNQQKEFTTSKPCYVRVSNSVVAPWHWFYVYGLGSKITVTYRFTGALDCDISVSDGFLTKTETDDPNVIEYTRVVEAKSAKDDDNIVIFQYTPHTACSVSLEVVYDQQVRSQFDVRNTIYFVDDLGW